MQKKFIFLTLNIAWASLTWRLTTTPNLVVAPDNWFNSLMMNGGHFIFFGVQAVLLRDAISDMRYAKYYDLICIVLASLYGLLIELVQRNIPGRSADPVDWILDTLGAITFLAILKKIKIGKNVSNL